MAKNKKDKKPEELNIVTEVQADSIFVDPDRRDEVWDEAGLNVIYIRHKMGVQTNALVKTELLRLRINADELEEGQEIQATIAVELQQVALLIHNITGWEGPRFIHPVTREPMACNAKHIRMFKPSDPHVKMVLQRIGENNKEPVEPPPSKPSQKGKGADQDPNS